MELLHRVVDLLELNAIYAVDQKDTVALVDSVKAALRVADTLREEPFGFPLGHRRGLIGRVAETLQWASGMAQLSKDQQLDLDQRLEAIAWPMSLRDRLVSERCAFRAIYGHPTPEILKDFGVTQKSGQPISTGWIVAFRWLGLLRLSEATFLQRSEKIIDVCTQFQRRFRSPNLRRHCHVA